VTDKEEMAETLRQNGIQFTETPDTISYRTKHWVADHHYDPEGRLVGSGYGNLASVQKLELHE
jgi:hypothetical protein